jgi:penicillin-binding protein 2
MHAFHMHARRRRARGASAIASLGLIVLCGAFFQTQVLKRDDFALEAEQNSQRPMPVPSARGAILDRNGLVIASNQPGYSLSIVPGPRDSVRAVLGRLSPVLNLTPERVQFLERRRDEEPTLPLTVTTDLTFDQLSAIQERVHSFPQVLIDMRPRRSYPKGSAVAHLVGYVSEVSKYDLTKPEYASYVRGQIIGKAGLERQYEDILGGKPGVNYVEVDAFGRIVGGFLPRTLVPSAAGKDLKLYLDLELQRYVEHIFPKAMRGSIVAMEPGTGHILAIYSSPNYDPNEFVGGIASSTWSALQNDEAKPLIDRSVQGLYPPGSTFKLATAAIALELGLIDPEAVMPIPCSGGLQYGNRYFRCWEKKGHGYVNLADAIKHSCDVYFYQVGLKIGLERLLAEGTRLGFAAKSGIDLPVERTANWPNNPDWYRRRFGWKPTQAEVLSLAIGQGPNDQTTVKIAQFYAALAADGKVGPPRIANVDTASTKGGWDLHLSENSLKWLREGLRRVTATGGTAGLSALEHWDWVGKTGTAQNPHGEDHGWFAGMGGPHGGKPEVVVAALVEFGEHGSDVAQFAAKTADYYLRRKHGMPIDTIQTLREYLNAGRPTPWVTWH